MGGNELPHLPPNQLWVGHCYEPLPTATPPVLWPLLHLSFGILVIASFFLPSCLLWQLPCLSVSFITNIVQGPEASPLSPVFWPVQSLFGYHSFSFPSCLHLILTSQSSISFFGGDGD